MSKKKNKNILINIILLTVLLSSFFPLVSLPTEKEGVFNSFTPLSSQENINTGGIGSSEEESIDSFDVHPESGRWENILDDSIEDRITDSLFENLVVQNETSGSSGYEMNRGTVKTDGKFEWRMKSDGSGNQTEYFRDVLGDEADFTEDDEGITDVVASTSVDNGILTVVPLGQFDGFKFVFDPDISTNVYSGIKFKAKAESEYEIFVSGVVSGTDFEKTNVLLTTDWVVYEFDFSSFNNYDEGRLITELFFRTQVDTTDDFFVDYVKIIGDYDFATHVEGEFEDTWDFEEGDDDSWNRFAGDSVDDAITDGDLIVNVTGSANTFVRYRVNTSIDSNLFHTIKVRAKGSENGLFFRMENEGVAFHSAGVLTTDYQTFTFTDFDSDWNGIVTFFDLLLREVSGEGNFDADERFFISYILLLGEFNPSDSIIGLMDSVGTPLLNISTHFYGNNTARFEFELLDSTGELSYHWYSDLYDDLNQFIIGKATFDVLRSRLEITITAENNSRIDKITFPNEFIVDSGLTPPLFSNEIAPYIFISTHTIDHSWQSLFLDWIKADYKEREWTQTDIPTDAFIIDEWDACRESDDSDESIWSLTVPYLDAVSGIISANTTDNSLQTDADNIQIGVEIYGVDADDGGLHLIAGVSTGFVSVPAAFIESNYGECYDGGILQYEEKLSIASSSTAYSPLLSFSFSLKEDRSESIMTARYFPDQTNEDLYYDFAVESSIGDFVTDPSQEFVISVFHNFNSIPATYDAYTFVKTFSIIERNIFNDFGKFVEGVIGGAQDIFSGGGDIFTALFRWLGGMIAAAFSFVGDSLEVVFVAVGAAIVVALSPIVISLSTLASDIWSGIGTALDFLETAIGDVAAGIWTAMGDALDFITDAITGIAAAIWVAVLAVAEDLADLVVDIIDFLIGLAGNIVSAIWDFITTAIFFLWDALGLPDLLAIINLFLVSFVEVVNAVPAFLNQVIPAILQVWALFAALGVIIFLILPTIGSDSVGEFIDKFLEYFFKDATFGISILGFSGSVPIGLLWMVTVITTVLSSTIFGGFF